MKNIKIAIQIKKIKNSEGKVTLRATVPMQLIFEEDFDAKWLDEEIKKNLRGIGFGF